MKGVIMIIDGMADRPHEKLSGKTPLEAAETPNMDRIAESGVNGIMDPIKPGVRAGSDTSHLSILGYDPYSVYTGRGPFEAAGVGVDVKPGDIAFRCNFATADENLVITDRRAGRIRSETSEIARTINSMEIEGFEDVEIIFRESTGHRAVLVLRGPDLADSVSDADPKSEGKPPKKVKSTDGSPESMRTAEILNMIVERSYEVLKDHPVNLKRISEGEAPANIILPRGAGAVPDVEKFQTRYGIRAACIAETGLIKGIGNLTGMDVIDVEGATGGIDTDLDGIREAIISTLNDDYDFLLINIDGADEAGHDGDLEGKLEFIEKVDAMLGDMPEMDDVCFILTADHSTPVSVMDHTGDPVPIVITGPGVRVDGVKSFGERAAAAGGLCRIRGSDIMDILLDLMNRKDKFGA